MAKLLFSILLSLVAFSAYAGTEAEVLSNCLADNTTGKERKELAKWIFVAMSAHPEISDLANISDDEREKSNKAMAGVVMKLLTDTCALQTQAAIKAEGESAIESSFEVLGKVAMQEIMSNQDVSTAIGAYTKYLDTDKISAVIGNN